MTTLVTGTGLGGMPRHVAGALDAFSSLLIAAYGMRRLVSTWSGPLVTVRRSSDNATLDVYPAGNGWPVTDALLSWCGSGSAHVTRWWDQSGSGRHADQTTASAQPTLINAGIINTINGKPAIKLVELQYFTISVSPIFSASSLSIIAILHSDNYAIGRNQAFITSGDGTVACWISPTAHTLNANILGASEGYLNNSKAYLLTTVYSNENSFMAVNGDVTYKNFSTSLATFGGVSKLLTGTNSANNFLGKAGGIIVLSAISPSDLARIYGDQNMAWGLSA